MGVDVVETSEAGEEFEVEEDTEVEDEIVEGDVEALLVEAVWEVVLLEVETPSADSTDDIEKFPVASPR
jgi:hypothetical protein